MEACRGTFAFFLSVVTLLIAFALLHVSSLSVLSVGCAVRSVCWLPSRPSAGLEQALAELQGAGTGEEQ